MTRKLSEKFYPQNSFQEIHLKTLILIPMLDFYIFQSSYTLQQVLMWWKITRIFFYIITIYFYYRFFMWLFFTYGIFLDWVWLKFFSVPWFIGFGSIDFRNLMIFDIRFRTVKAGNLERFFCLIKNMWWKFFFLQKFLWNR